MNKLTNTLLALCLIGIVLVLYHQTIYVPKHIALCKEVAINAERVRNFDPTKYGARIIEIPDRVDQDTALYMKNFISCFADQ